MGMRTTHLTQAQTSLLSIQDFVDAVQVWKIFVIAWRRQLTILQYAHMSHCHANPLTIFLSSHLEQRSISDEHWEALRNVPSFRRCHDITIVKEFLY